MTVLLLILVLSFLVIIHELGHLFAALWSKVKVEEFGLGYPPKAHTLFTWRGIPFTLNWIPFGGFVRMAGEEPGTTHSKEKGQFTAASLPKRLLIILAGASVNFLYGIIVFTIIFSILGVPLPLEKQARIGYVAAESQAEKAGVPKNVSVLSLQTESEDAVAVQSSAEVISYVKSHLGKTVTITTTGECTGVSCQEMAQTFTAYLRTPEETPAGQGALGIAFDEYTLQFYPWWQMPFKSAYYGTAQALSLGKQILVALQSLGGSLFSSGSIPEELAGPIGIVDQAQSTGLVKEGFMEMFAFSAMLSINLAIMNVLPIPPLDGGRAVFLLLEPVMKKKHLEKLEYWTNYSGYIFLLVLIVVVTARDVWRIFAR